MISRNSLGRLISQAHHLLHKLRKTPSRLILLSFWASILWGIPAESAAGQNENIQSPTTETNSHVSSDDYQSAATKLLADDLSSEAKTKAAELYLLAALDGNDEALMKFGDLYLQGARPPNDLSPYSQAAPEVAELLFTLGMRYAAGNGVDQSTERALVFFKPAAQAGHTNAQFALGYTYHSQDPFTDHDQAIVWYSKAAEAGSPGAMASLAKLYLDQYEQDHIQEKLGQAKQLFEKAAATGSGQATFEFAMQAESGIFPDISIDRVKQLYQDSSDLGVTRGNYRLAMLYLDEGNYNGAIEQLKIADEEGFEYRFEGGIESPKRILARMYATGIGVETDPDRAIAYDPEEALYSIVNEAHRLATENQRIEALSLLTWAEGIAKQYDLSNHLKNIAWYKAHALVLEERYREAFSTTSGLVENNQFSDAGAVRFYGYYVIAAHHSLDFDVFSRIFTEYIERLEAWKKESEDDSICGAITYVLNDITADPKDSAATIELLSHLAQKANPNIASHIYAAIGEIHLDLDNARQANIYFTLAAEHSDHYEYLSDRIDQQVNLTRRVDNDIRLDTNTVAALNGNFEGRNFWELYDAYLWGFDEKSPERTKPLLDHLVGLTSGEFKNHDDPQKYLLVVRFLAEYQKLTGTDSESEITVYKSAFQRFGLDLYGTPLSEIRYEDLLEFREVAAATEGKLDDAIASAIEIISRTQDPSYDRNHADSIRITTLSRLATYYTKTGETWLYRATIADAMEALLDRVERTGSCSEYFYLDPKSISEAFNRAEITDYLDRMARAHIVSAETYRGLEQDYRCRDDIKTAMLFYSALNEEKVLDSNYAFRLSQIETLNQLTLSLNMGVSKNLIGDREVEALINEYSSLSLSLKQWMSSSNERNSTDAISQNSNYRKLIERRSIVEGELAERVPAFHKQWSSTSVDITDVSAKLFDNEALVKFSRPEENRLLAWVIKKDSHRLFTLHISESFVSEKIALIKSTLSQDAVRSVLDIRPFDIEAAHQLYSTIWQPLESFLEGVDRIYALPSGDLATLPLEVLPRNRPSTPINSVLDFPDYKDIDWMNDRYEFVYPPSVSSFMWSASFNQHRPAQFLGIGAPAITDTTPAINPKQATLEIINQGFSSGSPLANLPPLPQTREQISALAGAFSDEPTLLLGRDAMESKLHGLTLSDYSTIAFATHGILGTDSARDASLVLSSPRHFSIDDDGLLTTSEISLLDLSANVVILSACNTATATESNGLNSIASSFMLAGAGSVLASHWSIEVNATTELLSSFAKAVNRDQNIYLSKALKIARQDMVHNNPSMVAAHPMFWGAFTIKGSSVH